MATMQSLWQDLIDQLKAQQEQVIKEIQSYPPPIPACDAQFNYLLDKRYQLASELSRVIWLAENQGSATSELIQFMAASPLIPEVFKEAILYQLQPTNAE